MSTTNLFTYVNDANIEGFLANEQDYEDKISFLGTTKKIRAKGKEYGGEDNIIESISVNGVAEEITNKNVDISVPTKLSELVNDTQFINTHQSLDNYVTKTDLSSQAYVSQTQLQQAAYLQSFTESDPTVPVHVKTITQNDITNWNNKVSNIQADWNATTGLAVVLNKPDISGFFDDVEYDSTNKTINFKQGNTVKDSIDATNFIKDGMVDSAYLGKGTTTGKVGKDCLIITFNTDAGKEDIEILLADIFNPDNYYDMSSADSLFVTKSELSSQSYVSQIQLQQAAYLQSFTETDPTVPTVVKNITAADINNWNSKTSNVGTITGITMNGTSKGTSGVVDLGTVLTAHQDISGKQDIITDLATIRSNASTGAAKVSANDSTITIQKGGSTVDTFTTNTSTAKTINLPNELPSYSSADSGKVLSVNSSGQLVWITPVSIYTGSGEPSNSTGNDGDIYLQQ